MTKMRHLGIFGGMELAECTVVANSPLYTANIGHDLHRRLEWRLFHNLMGPLVFPVNDRPVLHEWFANHKWRVRNGQVRIGVAIRRTNENRDPIHTYDFNATTRPGDGRKTRRRDP